MTKVAQTTFSKYNEIFPFRRLDSINNQIFILYSLILHNVSLSEHAPELMLYCLEDLFVTNAYISWAECMTAVHILLVFSGRRKLWRRLAFELVGW
jgi:hypothetical protein